MAQFPLGAGQIAGVAVVAHLHDSDAGAPAGHLWHEAAARNVAIGAGFAWIAMRRASPAGLLPMLTVFVAGLSLLIANDFLAGRMDVGRVLTHTILVAGYVIVFAMSWWGCRSRRHTR